MRRSSLATLVVAASLVSACHSERLSGPAAQDAVRSAQSLAPSRFGGALFFVDGKEVAAPTILDPQSIQSVEVLKGPRAAELYGDRARAGVVLITTKVNKEVQRPQ